MRILITISSWVGAATNGDSQAQRDTFLTDVAAYPELDYRFFIGDGTPTGTDETALLASFDEPWWEHQAYKAKATASRIQESFTYTPKPDEVILPVPDDYGHLAHKGRAQYRWALEHGFDYTLQCGTDVYIHVPRLMDSGFAQYDYWGHENSFHPAANGTYASGGGYGLSRKALQKVVDEPVLLWPEDMDVGRVMNKWGFRLHGDNRYSVLYPENLQHGDSLITAHLGPTSPSDSIGYDSQRMREAHHQWRGV